MNFRQFNVFRSLSGCLFFIIAVLILSAVNLFAQDNTSLAANISFDNLVAISGETDVATLKRPRIAAETKAAESSKSLPETAATSNIAAVAAQLEQRVFAVLNQKRAENNLPPLVWSDEMAKVARGHSQEMAEFKFFSHAGRNGSMVDDRADALGFKKWKAIGENIAYNRGYDNPAEFACERWMLSVSHRENILNARWKEAGIGISITPDGTYYFTEVFVVR